MPNRLPYWDKKFYYWIHCNRQRAMWNEPLSYYWFILRLRKWMNVHDAIYTPAAKRRDRWEYKATPEDNTRRRQKLNEENVMILDFDEIEELERRQQQEIIVKQDIKPILHHKPNPKMPNKIKMPKPKKTLWDRFLSFFKKHHES